MNSSLGKYVGLALLGICVGCQTIQLPPWNLSTPEWQVRHGQAVWTPGKGQASIAGELDFGASKDGRSFVQFTKTPFPIVTLQQTGTNWQIQFPSEKMTFGGAGTPPKRFIWAELAGCFSNGVPRGNWIFQRRGETEFKIENSRTLEKLEGYLDR